MIDKTIIPKSTHGPLLVPAFRPPEPQATDARTGQSLVDEHYFPISMPLLYGSIPAVRRSFESPNGEQDGYPMNLEFIHQDATKLNSSDRDTRLLQKYDTILA